MNIVAHNLMAMNANRMFGLTESKRSKSTEKLSSGYKVNRAADDAAGLAISEKMRRQIRGLTRAAANIQDGISYVQTAEGALGEVQDMLHRITELAIQSANGTNEDTDRKYLDSEVQQIKSEIDRVFKETSFNERKIWQGGVLDSWEETYTVSEPAVKFNSNSVDSTITEVNKTAMPKTNYTLSANDSGITVSWTGYNGTKYTSDVIPWEDELAGNSHSFNLADYLDKTAHPELEGIDLKFSYTVHAKANKSDVIMAINNQRVSSYIRTDEQTESFANVGTLNDVHFGVSLNYPSLLVSDKNFDDADDLFAEPASSKNISLDLNDEANWDKPINFTFTLDGIGEVKTSIADVKYIGTLNDPESEGFWHTETHNGQKYTYIHNYTPVPKNGSVNTVINALETDNGRNLLTDSSYGGTISFTYDLNATTAFTAKDGSTQTRIGTFTMSIGVTGSDTKEDVINKLKNIKGVDIQDDAKKSTLQSYNSANDSSNNVTYEKERTVYVYEDQVHIPIQVGSEAGHRIDIDYDCLDIKVLGLEATAVDTVENATQTIDGVKKALEVVSSQRSDFGSYQNRLEHAYNINMNIVENTQAAESQIRDTDIPEEMIRYSNANILAQAGTAMLSQANQSQQNVLNILQ